MMRPAISWFLVVVAVPAMSAAPVIVLESPSYDFGKAANDVPLIHDFVIRNRGDSELDITNVTSSCSACLQAGMDRTAIPPGESGVLHVRLDLRLVGEGPLSREVLVDCNDPKVGTVTVEMTGVVVPYYDISPHEIGIDLSQGQEEGGVEIDPQIVLHAPLSRISCDDKRVAVEVAEELTGGFALTVRALPTLPHGNTVVVVALSTADPRDPPCRVVCRVHNPADLELIPERLQFSAIAEGQERVLWVKQHGDAPLMLLDAVPPTDKFHCEIAADPLGNDYQIFISASDQDRATGQTGTLVLKLRDQAQKDRTVYVPVTVE
jgi:uncharacterized protein DUF1573